MHVLITSDTVGGVWTYTQELVTGLSRHGHTVTLVSFGKLPSPDQCEWLRALPGVDYHPTEYRLEWMEVADRDIDESRRYLEFLVHEVRPDVLHFSQYCYGDIDADVPRVVVAHSDVVSWWVAVHGKEPDDSPWIRSYRERVLRGIAAADIVVAPSKWMLDALTTYYQRPQQRRVIYNGRIPELFDPGRNKQQFALTVGRVWDEGKNVSLLLQSGPPLPVRIVGWAQEPGREKKTTPVCPSGIELLGPKSQPELRDLYAAAAIYVATSRYEPFGLSPLEAALSGCTLLMNDIPVFRELWGDAALYFRSTDSADLARTLGELYSQLQLCEQCGKQALQRAVQKFTAERMVTEYEDAYQQIVSSVVRVA